MIPNHPKWPGTLEPILIGQEGEFLVEVDHGDGGLIDDFLIGHVVDIFPDSISVAPSGSFADEWDGDVDVRFAPNGHARKQGSIIRRIA